jgi:hypothetical protein
VATLDDLIGRLDDSDPNVRTEAIAAVARLGRRAERAAPALTRIATSGLESETWRARHALARVSWRRCSPRRSSTAMDR